MMLALLSVFFFFFFLDLVCSLPACSFVFLGSGDDTPVGRDVCGVETWSRSGRKLTGETEKDR